VPDVTAPGTHNGDVDEALQVSCSRASPPLQVPW